MKLTEDLINLENLLNDKFKFSYDNDFGFYNKNIENLGSAVEFYAEFEADELLKNKENFEKIRESFRENSKRFKIEEILEENNNKNDKNDNDSNNNNKSLKISLKNSLAQNIDDFYIECLNRLYNFEYLFKNIDYTVENIALPLLDFSELKNLEEFKSNNENSRGFKLLDNFFVEKAYKKLHKNYCYTYLSNNNNFNEFIKNFAKGIFDKSYFEIYSLFFEEIFNKFSEINALNISKFKDLKKIENEKNALNEFKDFACFSYPYTSEEFRFNKFLNLNENEKLKSTLNKLNNNFESHLKKFNIKIHRNFNEFNLPNFLEEKDLGIVRNNIENSLFLIFDKYNKISENVLEMTKNFYVHINKENHITFEFNYEGNFGQLFEQLENYLRNVSLISNNLEAKNHLFSFINNVGYLVNDFSLLSLGFEFNMEFDLTNINKELFEKDYNYHKAKYPNGVISINQSSINDSNNNDKKILEICNNTNFEGFFNSQALKNIMEKSFDLIMNFKIENPIQKPAFDLDKNSNIASSENINLNNNNNFDNSACSIEGSSIHLNDSHCNSETGNNNHINSNHANNNPNVDNNVDNKENNNDKNDDDVLICDES